MYLTLDIGNTFSKAMVFDPGKKIRSYHFKNISIAALKKIFTENKIHASVFSSVGKKEKKIQHFLDQRSALIAINQSPKLPFRNLYKTPRTLGSDRIAAAAGAMEIFPGKNVLIIDSGTCITYDFINAKKEYLGGSISPGLQMRFKALHNFTRRLPLIHPKETFGLTGGSTKESILSGVQLGIVNEINGFIELYKKKYGTLRVVFTGGDAEWFAEHIKSSIFAAPDLVHTGLLAILKYNVG